MSLNSNISLNLNKLLGNPKVNDLKKWPHSLTITALKSPSIIMFVLSHKNTLEDKFFQKSAWF